MHRNYVHANTFMLSVPIKDPNFILFSLMLYVLLVLLGAWYLQNMSVNLIFPAIEHTPICDMAPNLPQYFQLYQVSLLTNKMYM